MSDEDPLSDPSKRREDSEHSIFERSKDGGYRLRDNVLFHLREHVPLWRCQAALTL